MTRIIDSVCLNNYFVCLCGWYVYMWAGLHADARGQLYGVGSLLPFLCAYQDGTQVTRFAPSVALEAQSGFSLFSNIGMPLVSASPASSSQVLKPKLCTTTPPAWQASTIPVEPHPHLEIPRDPSARGHGQGWKALSGSGKVFNVGYVILPVG